MTQVIKIDKNKVRLLNSEMDQMNDYINLLNGIAYACQSYDEYSEGYRNTVAVDLTVGCYMLGLDAHEVLERFVIAGLIDPSKDDEAPVDRVNRVLDYRHKFDWDWMIDPDQYLHMAKPYKFDDALRYEDGFSEEVKLFFKLV